MSARGPWAVRTREAGEGRAATARLLDDALLLEHALGVSVVELIALDGVEARAGAVTLHHHVQGALEIETADAPALAQAVTDAASGIPELAASLRAMGSPRAHPGSDHDAWFGPLLEARRTAHAAHGLEARLRAFDAVKLAAAAQAAIVQFAEARAPGRPREARALAEELREKAEGLDRAFGRLGIEEDAVADATDADRLLHWRSWVAALRAVFSAADGAWEAMLPALAEPRGTAGSFWRRVLGRGKRA